MSEDRRVLKDSAHRFLAETVAPKVQACEASCSFDWDLWKTVAQWGFVGATLPEEKGGQGLSPGDLAVLMECAGYHWLSLRALLNVANMVAGVLAAKGTEAQRARYLPALLAGDKRVWVGITEPNVGSDVNAVETRAVDRGDHFLLSGTKLWITNGAGDFGILLARVQPGPSGSGGLTAFLIDRTEVAYGVRPVGTMILRPTGTSELSFDEARVGRDAVIGEIGGGLKTILTTLNDGRLSVAAGAVGAGQAALDLARDYALTRRQFGRPIASFQLVQAMIVEMESLVRASRLLVADAGEALEAGQSGRLECSIAKKFATEAAHKVATIALQVHGGIGYSTDLPLERIFRDTRGGLIPEGTSEVQTLIIGRELLGVSAFGTGEQA